MAFDLSISIFLLLLTGAVTVKGSDLSDALDDNDSHYAPAVDRPKRWSGFNLFDGLRGNGDSSSGPKPTKPTAGDPKPFKGSGGDHFGFTLEDALHPAVKPTGKPGAGDCQESVLQKLGTIIDNQNQQLCLLMQMMARLPASSRFSEKSMR
ncbi:uncharacterized protein LOC121178098 isoform X2 [Toxotes jaculatrix]|uniref:uncharacterized protein LOC121178098 isoform X2 n=1 Tax=Toxotes jaculatrix TaxID=941984 RepID=UPI001B3B104C|nr:uncharacterized protein LOC121178098 isoform X2 [Toxotes jaculatrix]